MLSQLVKGHQDKQSKYKEQQEKKCKEALTAVHKLTDFSGWNQPWSGDCIRKSAKIGLGVEEVTFTFSKVHEADITMAFTG